MAPVTPPEASAAPAAVASPPQREEGAPFPIWLLIAPVVLVGLAIAAWAIRRRRRAEEPDFAEDVAYDPVTEPDSGQPERAEAEPAPSALPPAAGAPAGAAAGLVTTSLRPRLTIDLAPMRAGADTLRAIVECELVITNQGVSPALDVAVEAALLTAGSEDAVAIAGFLNSPGGTPVAPPFVLPAGATVRLPVQLARDRDTLTVISVGERRMFVPLVVVRLGFRSQSGSSGSAHAAFLIGIEREGESRMAPLNLARSGMRTRLGSRRLEVSGAS